MSQVQTGVISATEIWKRLRRILDPSGTLTINPDTVILGGDPAAIDAFAIRLNRTEPFKSERLALDVTDVAGVTTAGALLAAIIKWYEHHGWRVDD
jgi:hypothetical protein